MLAFIGTRRDNEGPRVHSNSSAKTKPAQASRRILYLQTGMDFYRYMITAKSAALLPLWVKSRHCSTSTQCPLYPQKQTFVAATSMSALCQKQTFCTALQYRTPLFDHLVAVASGDCGMITPSALAALRLMTIVRFTPKADMATIFCFPSLLSKCRRKRQLVQRSD